MGKVQCRKMWMGWRHNGEVDDIDDVGGIGIWIWKEVDVEGGSSWGDWMEGRWFELFEVVACCSGVVC